MASCKAVIASAVAAATLAGVIVIELQNITTAPVPLPTPMQETKAAVEKPLAPAPADVVQNDFRSDFSLDKPVVSDPAPVIDLPTPVAMGQPETVLPKPRPIIKAIKKAHKAERKIVARVETGIAGVIEPLHIPTLWEIAIEWMKENMRWNADYVIRHYPGNAD